VEELVDAEEKDNLEDDKDFNDDQSINEVDNGDEENDRWKDNDDSESNDDVDDDDASASDDADAECIKVPLQLGQINIEDILKFPGAQVQILDCKKVPKQNYNLFIAESICPEI